MCSVERICRLCLQEELENGQSYLLPLADDRKTVDMIRETIAIDVFVDERAQYYLCVECKELLLKCFDFRERCLVNDAIFRRKFSRSAATEEEEKTETTFLPADTVVLDGEKGEKREKKGNHSDEEELFLHEFMIETIEENNDDCDTYEPLQVEILQEENGSDSESLPKRKKSVCKKRSRKKADDADKANNKLPCAQCGKMIARNNINQHQLTHDPDRPQVFCSYCGKAFKDPRRMQMHINSNHTLEKKYPCDVCGKVYLRPASLKDHKLTKHSADKRYECSDCGRAFTSWAQRWHHFKKEHTTAKPFACTYCDWAFKFKCDLTLHIRKHTGEKPFKCDICGKAFNKSYNVVIHKKSHRNLLPVEQGTSPSDETLIPQTVVKANNTE
ncbi:zinc finger protein 664-like [Anopheles maculipalpis]|uniref:zinc finger protein 664-like n=1 Tax=Anopheles maculipalpis TaxID=1496333 RepID=UPI002158D3B2|nr:zinc finger protein 664-like [Anopheles maculipalpis]